MPERKIYILTGAVRTGKTTALVNWCAGKKDVSGILTPVINGRRFFMDAFTKEQFAMEADNAEKEILSIGRFHFSKTAFEKAIQIIRQSVGQPGWLLIDEIGPLELRGEGFYHITKEVLKSHSYKLISVVREGLTDKVGECFQLSDFTIITKEKLKEL
jgi:nucleoside-triphosphatase THEP1